MSTTESANNNTTVPPVGTGTTTLPGSDTNTTQVAPTDIANTTPLPEPTTQPGETLLNSSIIGNQLGVITHPTIGSGGVANSYANTKGSVELLSVGINKKYYGKLTYEIFDLYGKGGAIDPETVFRGETSVVKWDEGSQTGVILINKIIPCKANTSTLDGGMNIQVIIKDQSHQPIYHGITIPTNAIVTPAPTSGIVTPAPIPGIVTPAPTSGIVPTTPDPTDTVQITRDEFDTILDNSESNRVVIRGPNIPLGTNEVPLTISQENVNIKISNNDNLSVSKVAFSKLTNDGSLLQTNKTILGVTTTTPVVVNGTTSTTPLPPFSGLESVEGVSTTERPDRRTYVVYVDNTLPVTTPEPDLVSSTTPVAGVNVYASTTPGVPTTIVPVVINGTTSTTPQPPFSGLVSTTTPKPSTSTTTTTTTTSVAPLGTIDRGNVSTTTLNPGITEEPRIRIRDLSTSTTTPGPVTLITTTTSDPGIGTTLSPEDKETLDDLLNRARTAGGVTSTTTPGPVTLITTTTTSDPGSTSTTTGDPGTTTTGSTTTTTTTREPKPGNQVGSQVELLRALETFSNIYITQDFTVSTIINIPEGVTITGVNNPKITMSNTLVAFKITSSNVTLNGVTIQSVKTDLQSMGVGVLVTRSSPESLISVSNVNISNITFIDIGDPKKDSYGAISVRGYNATQSSPNVDDLIPVLLSNAEPFSNITIDSCTFNNTANTAIDFWTVKNSKISNCTFNGTVGDFDKGDGIRGVNLQDTIITDCYLQNISQVGIRILGPKSFNVVLSRNTIDNCDGTAGIMIYYGVNGATVHDNQISNSNNGFLITGATTSIDIVNNNTDNIKVAPLIISGLSNDIEARNNTFVSTFGSTVVTVLQSWSINLDKNNIIDHSFEIGPGLIQREGY